MLYGMKTAKFSAVSTISNKGLSKQEFERKEKCIHGMLQRTSIIGLSKVSMLDSTNIMMRKKL